MAEFPALPLFTDAYLGDTTHLTTFEHGAYLLLLIVSWRAPGCCLPDDDALLARYARTTKDKWAKLRPILEPFFRVNDGFWRQARLQDEFQHLQSRKSQQIEAGQASAKAKSLKRANRGSTTVAAPLQRNVNETSTPTPTPITVVSKEDTTAETVFSDDRFWGEVKAYLKPERADPGSLIGKWVKTYGKIPTAEAITRAQLERPVQRIPFIEGCLRQSARAEPVVPL